MSPLLAASGLGLRFGAISALVEVDAELWPGEVLAVVGESGSGKTTLLNVLSGTVRPDQGVVSYTDPAGEAHDLHARRGIAVVLVTHDIGVARLLAGRIMVMQRGRVVEAGLTDQVLDDPQHAYTQLLVSSVLQA